MSSAYNSLKSKINSTESAITHEGGKIVSSAKSGANKAFHEAKSLENRLGKDVSSAGSAVVKDAKIVGNDFVLGAEKLPGALSSAGGYIESGALRIGNDVSTLESDVVPSFNKVIVETGLVIAGVIALSLVVLKF